MKIKLKTRIPLPPEIILNFERKNYLETVTYTSQAMIDLVKDELEVLMRKAITEIFFGELRLMGLQEHPAYDNYANFSAMLRYIIASTYVKYMNLARHQSYARLPLYPITDNLTLKTHLEPVFLTETPKNAYTIILEVYTNE